MSFAGVIARRGAVVTFSRDAMTYSPGTGVATDGGTGTCVGSAMEIEGDADLYATLGLVESNIRTLLFRPSTAGSLPDVDWTVVWGGETLTVKHVQRLAMAGTATAAKVAVAR